jgi:hypothetical protein
VDSIVIAGYEYLLLSHLQENHRDVCWKLRDRIYRLHGKLPTADNAKKASAAFTVYMSSKSC